MKLTDHSEIISVTSGKSDGNQSFKWGEKDDVIKNREVFLAKHNLHINDCVVMEVEHKDEIIVVNNGNLSPDPMTVITVEALITKTRNITLFLLTADCLPISVYDPVKEVIALAHLGWKPTGLKLIKKVIKQLQTDFGSDPKNILVNIGPCIHKDSYKLEVVEQNNEPEWRPYIEALPSGEVTVDLVAFNKDQLLETGVSESNISVDPIDTVTSSNHFSHYRSVRTGEPEGRLATILALRKF